VLIYNAAGALVQSLASAVNTGVYSLNGLAPGIYFARTVVSPTTPYYTDQAWGGAPCAPCTVTTTSNPIVVTANTTSHNIDFALVAGGSISGTVTNSVSTNPVPSIDVQLYNAAGTLVKTAFSNASGGFTLDGLPAGTYFARTAVPAGSGLVDQLFNTLPCVACVVTTGTPIVVTNGTTQSGVNFALATIPTIAPIPNVSTRVNVATAVPITVGSAAGVNGVTLSAVSSNPALVPNATWCPAGRAPTGPWRSRRRRIRRGRRSSR